MKEDYIVTIIQFVECEISVKANDVADAMLLADEAICNMYSAADRTYGVKTTKVTGSIIKEVKIEE